MKTKLITLAMAALALIPASIAQPVPEQKLLPVDYGDLQSTIIHTEGDVKKAMKELVDKKHVRYVFSDEGELAGAKIDDEALDSYGRLIDVYRLVARRSPEVDRHTGHGVQAPVEEDGKKWYSLDIHALKNFASMRVSEMTGVGILSGGPRFIEAVQEADGYRISHGMRLFYNDLVEIYGKEFTPELRRDDGLQRIPALSGRQTGTYFLMDEDSYRKFVTMNGWRLRKAVPSHRPKDWKFNEEGEL